MNLIWTRGWYVHDVFSVDECCVVYAYVFMEGKMDLKNEVELEGDETMFGNVSSASFQPTHFPQNYAGINATHFPSSCFFLS
mmetsp:Transcript_2466/g.3881  ORF Transcript_2466/g.3881 Transcript_2466/m.3881 type:complete len:82 (-) Transcript_2466:576-821(-)